jgi:hypothetical protein
VESGVSSKCVCYCSTSTYYELELQTLDFGVSYYCSTRAYLFVFITAVPIIKMFAWGKGDSGGLVLRERTSRGMCGLVSPSHHALVHGSVCVHYCRTYYKAVCGGDGDSEGHVL